MELKQEQACRKKNGKECSFEFKTFVIEQIKIAAVPRVEKY